ncbi:hypothetical protein CRG98_026763 [Punica granatum]|uniref:Uncharacterized protein n=1 Tax=Punica granatum TaxID=22663 RepID=A0A2I0J9J6_PUNGR|nr:hypothetical protein CRG98_026763 [Punica granatum]
MDEIDLDLTAFGRAAWAFPSPWGLPLPSDPVVHASELSPSLLRLRYLNHLDLSGLRILGSTPIPAFIGSMKHLSYLNLSNVGFHGAVPPHLGNLTSLEVLDLQALWPNYGLLLAHSHWISRLVALKYLDLSGVPARKARDLMQVLNTLPSLSHLAMSSCFSPGAFSISPGLFNSSFLARLQYLDLSFNFLQGPVPTFLRNMTSIRHLDLHGNDLNCSIPIWFSDLNGLVHLNLEGNQLDSIEGGFSFFIRDKCRLRFLNLEGNQLQGEISRNSSGICAFGLEFLSLRSNRFTGIIPEGLGQLSRLEFLGLSYNSLEGTVSELHFTNLLGLKYLDIGYNHLTVKLDSDWAPPFRLNFIMMRSCRFGTEFPQWIRSQKDAHTLYLSNASISGEMPQWLATELKLRTLDLSNNFISGRILNFSSTMARLDLSYNLISGSIPPSIGENLEVEFLFLSDNLLTGPIPASLCQLRSVISLDLSRNKLSGWIPNCWGNATSSFISGKLWNFSSTMGLLDLSYNLISGSIPPSIGENLEVYNLFLSDNHLTGPIPASLCKLRSVRSLDLSRNKLSGWIPNCWGNATLPSIINFSSNRLSGVIPSSIGNLVVSSLHLNNNSLHGEVPDSFRNLLGLEMLDLGENKLSGVLPAWIGREVQSLRTLRLRENHFTGTLPMHLCSLFQLQILDLAGNNLHGTIPRCFGSLIGMSHRSSSPELNDSQYALSAPAPPSIHWDQQPVAEFESIPQPSLREYPGKDWGHEVAGVARLLGEPTFRGNSTEHISSDNVKPPKPVGQQPRR